MAAVKDAVLERAVDLARDVAVEIAQDASDVGEYLGAVRESERLVSHRFACTARGYRGWAWTVTVARVPRGRTATVCEAALLPGDDAILAKPWVPWSQRLRPGDIGPGDVLPFRPDDPRLEPGFAPTGDPEVDEVAIDELALARVRVLSPEGLRGTADRWYRGSHGPTTSGAVASSAACGSCGFLVPLQGSLGTLFGVCANEWSPDDGKVVSLDHGCGAHSETDVEQGPSEWPAPDPLLDETAIDLIDLPSPSATDTETTDTPATDATTTDAPTTDAPDTAERNTAPGSDAENGTEVPVGEGSVPVEGNVAPGSEAENGTEVPVGEEAGAAVEPAADALAADAPAADDVADVPVTDEPATDGS